MRFTSAKGFRGQRAERTLLIPSTIYEWVESNVVFAGKVGNCAIYRWRCPDGHRGNFYGDAPLLAMYLRGLFPEVLAEWGAYLSEEYVFVLLSALGLSPKKTGANPNPNRDNSVNLRRRQQVVSVPGVRR